MKMESKYYVVCPDCEREIEATPFERNPGGGACGATGRSPVQYKEDYCENCGYPVALAGLRVYKREPG